MKKQTQLCDDQIVTDQIEPGMLLKFTAGFSFVVSGARHGKLQQGLMINVYLYNNSTSLMMSLAIGDVISSGENCESSESR